MLHTRELSTAEGVEVPEVLRPYMGGITLMKFVNEPPKQSVTQQQAATATKAGADNKTAE